MAHAAAPHAPGAVANLLDAVHSAGEEEAKARAVLVDQLAVKQVSYLFVVVVVVVVVAVVGGTVSISLCSFVALWRHSVGFTERSVHVKQGGEGCMY